jgi:hypothetical protein
MSASVLAWPLTGVRRLLSDREYKVLGTHARSGTLATSSGEVWSLGENGLRLTATSISTPHRSISVEVLGPSIPEWAIPAVESAVHLLALQQDWDSYGAPPVDPNAIERGIELLGRVMSSDSLAPTFVPTSSGGCQLEWHTPSRDLEIEISADAKLASVYFDDRIRGAKGEGALSEYLEIVREMLSHLGQET